jgi:alkylation response protein AidB-like acyl-CoA dehydrogenase
MDLRFTPEENAFRQEVRAFFRDNLRRRCTRSWSRAGTASKQDLVDWTRKLNEHGWAVPHWPVE